VGRAEKSNRKKLFTLVRFRIFTVEQGDFAA
jgi:hypothetical protein